MIPTTSSQHRHTAEHEWFVCSVQLHKGYLEELCDALSEVLVALDVELQLVESGRKRGCSATLVTTVQRNKHKDA